MNNNKELLEKIEARLLVLEDETEKARSMGLSTENISDQIVELHLARERVAAEMMASTPPPEDKDSLDEEEIEVDEEVDAGFKPQPLLQGPGKADPNNTVAMSAKLRRQIGLQAADFLDEYGQEVHKRVTDFILSIKDKALDLGTDGQETTLRKELRQEVGARGLRAIEPIFEEWRAGVAKQLAADIREAFPTAEQAAQPSEVPEENIPSLLGIDHMEKEEENVKKNISKKKKKKKNKKNKQKKVKSLDDDLRDAEQSFLKEAEASVDATAIVVATRPVKMTITAGVDIQTPSVASDFIPSGHKPVILE